MVLLYINYLIILVIFLSKVGCLSIDQCTNRFEYKDDIVEARPQLKNCTFVRETYPSCRDNITVLYAEMAPYVYLDINHEDRPAGMLPGNIQFSFHIQMIPTRLEVLLRHQ